MIHFFISLCIVIYLTITPGLATLQPSQSAPPVAEQTNATPQNPQQPQSKSGLETLAKQALLIDYATGTILLEKNADELMYPSSMTKIMTAYLIFEKLKNGQIQMDTLFPVSERAWRMGGTKMFVPLNGAVTVEDLLKGIIVQSGNDACIVVAEGLKGSEEAFAQDMTAKALAFGALNTTFKNASGWPDPEHLTTARDLAIIAHRIMTDFPEFYPFFSMKEYVFNTIRQWNRNSLLYKNIGCDGIKTGFTDNGGYGIVASLTQGDRRLILVVNGLPSEKIRANEAEKLLTWGLQTFNNYTIFKAGQLVDNIPVWLGKENFVPATLSQEVVLTLSKSSRKGLKVNIHYDAPIPAPIQKGTVIGKLIITAPSLAQSLEVPLVAAVPVDKAGFLKQIRDSLSYLIWGKS